jgi:hypothetical protein
MVTEIRLITKLPRMAISHFLLCMAIIDYLGIKINLLG